MFPRIWVILAVLAPTGKKLSRGPTVQNTPPVPFSPSRPTECRQRKVDLLDPHERCNVAGDTIDE